MEEPQRRTRIAEWADRYRRVIGIIAVSLCVTMTVLWIVVVPDQAHNSSGIRALLLRWGHSLCWFFLSIASGVWTLRGPRAVVSVLAWCGLASYVGFLAALA